MELKNLTEAEWHRLKKAAGIKSAPFFKKHDAAVGKYIKAYQKAREKWKAQKGLNALLELNSALRDLNTAMDSFIKKKEFKTELAKELQSALTAWQKEISAKQSKLQQKVTQDEAGLRDADAKFVDSTVKNWGLPGVL